MVRRPIQEERRQSRRGQSLKQAVVSAPLKRRYDYALIQITSFWQETNLEINTIDDLDSAVGTWLEHIFFEGLPKSLARDGLASLQYHLPSAAGRLRFSWKMVKAWQRLEPPQRVIPLSPLMTQAFAGACISQGFVRVGAAMLMAFDGMLRPGELYQVRIQDITFYQNQSVIALRDTKTGKRKGSSEMAMCDSVVANYWLRQAVRSVPPTQLLLDVSPALFRRMFNNLVNHFDLSGLFAIYSLRRGGATWDFLSHKSMELTLLRGRWSSTSTARIYLQDTVATVSLLQLTPLQRAHARLAASHLHG